MGRDGHRSRYPGDPPEASRINSGQNQLRVFVHGKPYEGDPTAMPLGQRQYIVITYGTQAELPTPIPDKYSRSVATSCAPSC